MSSFGASLTPLWCRDSRYGGVVKAKPCGWPGGSLDSGSMRTVRETGRMQDWEGESAPGR